MAYTKKTTNTKSTTSEKEMDEVVNKTVKETVLEKKEVRKFEPGDMILCRCVRPNKVVFHSTKTDTRYEFGGYGDVNEVDYSDLLKLKSSRSPVLFQPKILIEDKELREQWARDLASVSDEYDGVYNTEDLFDRTPDEFEAFLRKASDGVKDLVRLCAINLIRQEKLTDLRLIRIIDDVLGTKYKEFI